MRQEKSKIRLFKLSDYQSVPSQIIEIGRIDYNLRLPSKDNPLIAPRREKTCLRGFANNKGADQPAHPRSMISSLVFAHGKVLYLELL